MFFRDFNLGLSTFFKAHRFLMQNKLGWVFVFPLLFNILLFFGGYELMKTGINDLEAMFRAWVEGSKYFGDSWVFTSFSWFINIILRLLFFFVFAYFGGYVVLIVMSPVFAYLSEKVAQKVTGNDYPLDWLQLINDVWRGVVIALRNLTIEIGITILAFIALLIPVVGLLSPVVMFFVSAYFYGFSYMDYTNERRRLSINQSITEIRAHKGLAVANGAAFSVFLLIPFLGTLIASFMAIYSVTGATLAMLDESYEPALPNVKKV